MRKLTATPPARKTEKVIQMSEPRKSVILAALRKLKSVVIPQTDSTPIFSKKEILDWQLYGDPLQRNEIVNLKMGDAALIDYLVKLGYSEQGAAAWITDTAIVRSMLENLPDKEEYSYAHLVKERLEKGLSDEEFAIMKDVELVGPRPARPIEDGNKSILSHFATKKSEEIACGVAPWIEATLQAHRIIHHHIPTLEQQYTRLGQVSLAKRTTAKTLQEKWQHRLVLESGSNVKEWAIQQLNQDWTVNIDKTAVESLVQIYQQLAEQINAPKMDWSWDLDIMTPNLITLLYFTRNKLIMDPIQAMIFKGKDVHNIDAKQLQQLLLLSTNLTTWEKLQIPKDIYTNIHIPRYLYKQCTDDDFAQKVAHAKLLLQLDELEQERMQEAVQNNKLLQKECLEKIASLERWVEVVREGLQTYLSSFSLGHVTVQK